MKQRATTASPPFDPETLPGLNAVRRVAPLRMTMDTLEKLREFTRGEGAGVGQTNVDLTLGGAVSIQDVQVDVAGRGDQLILTVMRPAVGEGPWPCIYFTHGGGFVVGNRRQGLETFVECCADPGVVVVSPEYRLAPEHPDPAPMEDCYAGLEWTAEHAPELGIDLANLMVAGVSAGGGLAAGLALMARDRGFPALSHQILSCPTLDDRLTTHSSDMLDNEGMLDRNDLLFAWTSLLGDRRGGPDVSPYAAPARATDLGGLPRTYLDVGSVEVLRDEVIQYAQRLSQCGVSVDLHVWGGGTHGFDLWAPEAAISRASRWVRQEFLRRALRTI